MAIVDEWYRIGYTDNELCDLVRRNGDLDVKQVYLIDPTKYNSAVDAMFSDLEKITDFQSTPICSTAAWHQSNQSTWLMPEEYQKLDVEQYLLDSCESDRERDRIAMELQFYHERGAIDLLRYVKYLVDTIKKHKVLLGVGRGSSVASFVLYKLGLHQINSLDWDLDIREFLK